MQLESESFSESQRREAEALGPIGSVAWVQSWEELSRECFEAPWGEDLRHLYSEDERADAMTELTAKRWLAVCAGWFSGQQEIPPELRDRKDYAPPDAMTAAFLKLKSDDYQF